MPRYLVVPFGLVGLYAIGSGILVFVGLKPGPTDDVLLGIGVALIIASYVGLWILHRGLDAELARLRAKRDQLKADIARQELARRISTPGGEW